MDATKRVIKQDRDNQAFYRLTQRINPDKSVFICHLINMLLRLKLNEILFWKKDLTLDLIEAAIWQSPEQVRAGEGR